MFITERTIGQFFINDFSSPFRLDRNRNGNGILLYIRKGIASNLLAIENIIEAFFLEINLHKIYKIYVKMAN